MAFVVVLLAALVLAGPASAADRQVTLTPDVVSVSWQGIQKNVVNPAGPVEAAEMCGKGNTNYCEETLVRVVAPATGPGAQVAFRIEGFEAPTDFDLRVYESDAEGKAGTYLGPPTSDAGTGRAGDPETKTVDVPNGSSYYLVRVVYVTDVASGAIKNSYTGKATFLGAGGTEPEDVKPFGSVSCVPQSGVRFCEGSIPTRVKSFDGVPLDFNVALPADKSSGLPLVVLSHGWGGGKAAFGGMVAWARKGYAVMAISARGFADSCGSPASREADPSGCAQGYVRLDDNRYEVRDVQTLAGLLADQGIVDGQRIGLVGGSYGGGLSIAGAVLKDRVMDVDGSLKPWRSPAGRPMRIAGATPSAMWTDLNHALAPNGRSLDYVVVDPVDALVPYGIAKSGMISQLGIGGADGGYYGPGVGSFTALWGTNGDQPPNPAYDAFIDEIARYHSSYSLLDTGGPPAPMLITSGFTDDVFPVDEAVRLYNKVRARWPGTPISLRDFDTGHFRAQGKAADTALAAEAQRAWIDYYVKGEPGPAPFRGVTALSLTCPKEAPSGGPYVADSWAELHPGEVRRAFADPQIVTSSGGDPQIAAAFMPAAGPTAVKACAQTTDETEVGTATYRIPFTEEATLLGSPTVVADIAVNGEFGQIVTRLLDVDKSTGMQTLVARGIYRPDPTGRQVFQLHPSGWTFKPGHEAKLQLLGNEPTYAHPPSSPFTITVSGLELRLPTWDRPNGRDILSPSEVVLPPGAVLAPDVDTALPVSTASAPAATKSSTIQVDYTAADTGGSGLERLELYTKAPGDSAYSLAATDSTPSSSGEHFSYTAAAGDGNYAFYTVARDKAGNAESAPGRPDATTTLDTRAPAASCDPAASACTGPASPNQEGGGPSDDDEPDGQAPLSPGEDPGWGGLPDVPRQQGGGGKTRRGRPLPRVAVRISRLGRKDRVTRRYRVRWTPVGRRYDVQVRLARGGSWRVLSFATRRSSIVFRVRPGARYVFRVRLRPPDGRVGPWKRSRVLRTR